MTYNYSLYCMYSFSYEIQLIPDVRRKGLGKFLMQILELIGHKACMKKIVLTIFKGVCLYVSINVCMCVYCIRYVVCMCLCMYIFVVNNSNDGNKPYIYT